MGDGSVSYTHLDVYKRQPQYCSLNDLKLLNEIDVASDLAWMWTQPVVAHFSFHATWIDPIPTRNDAFFKNLVQQRFM